MFKLNFLTLTLLSISALSHAETRGNADIYPESSQAEQTEILPMRAYCDMREASIWIMAKPNSKLEISSNGKTSQITTNGDGIATARLNSLKPNTEYACKIAYSDKKDQPVSVSVKTIPDYEKRSPAPDFKFAIIGRVHTNDPVFDEPFKTPGGEYEIFDAVKKQNPDAVIWANNGAMFRTADYGKPWRNEGKIPR